MGLPSAFSALTIALEGPIVQVISDVREYTVLPSQYCGTVVPSVLVRWNSAVEFSVHFLEEGFKAVVYSLAVKVSSLLLQIRPANCAFPQLRIKWLNA